MPQFSDVIGTIRDSFQIGLGNAAKAIKFGGLGTLSWNPTAARSLTLPDASGELALKGSGGASPGSALIIYKGNSQTFPSSALTLASWESSPLSSSGITQNAAKTLFTVENPGVYLIYVGFQLYEVDALRRVLVDVVDDSDVLLVRLNDIGSGQVAVFSTLYLGGSAILSFAANAKFGIRIYCEGTGGVKNYYNANEVVLNQIKLAKVG